MNTARALEIAQEVLAAEAEELERLGEYDAAEEIAEAAGLVGSLDL